MNKIYFFLELFFNLALFNYLFYRKNKIKIF